MPNKNVFGTLEWASHNENFINGCLHDCLYCYSKEMAIRFGRKKPGTWHIEEIKQKNLSKTIKKYSGQIMFPSSHDLIPDNITEILFFLNRLLESGNHILIVSKPHLFCMNKICDKFALYKSKILFRFTIGSKDSKLLKYWEPNAPDFQERFECLKLAFDKGYKTSLSIEPMLDALENIEELFNLCLPYITDAIWLGRPNAFLRRLKVNGVLTEDVKEKALALEKTLSDTKIKEFYKKHKNNPKLKWKDSIKTIVGIQKPSNIGCDI